MDKIFQALAKIQNPIARIIFIILTLGAVGITVFFSTGCAYKFHADSIDNVTQELFVKGGEK